MGLAIPPVEACRTGGYNTVPSPFSMDDTTFRVLGYRLVDTLATYLDKLPHEPVYHPLPAEVRLELEKMNIPAEGLALEDIIESFLRHILPYGHGQNHPCFAAFANPAASNLSMLAAFASAAANTSGAGGNYAAIYVERAVIRWLMELIGFPARERDQQAGVPGRHGHLRRSALRPCARHSALDEGHVQAIVDAVRDARQRRVRASASRPAGAEDGDEMTGLDVRFIQADEDARCAS